MAVSTKVYLHTQSVAANTWSIAHNLNCKPVVEVLVDTGGGARTKIFPQKVMHASDTVMQITFSSPRSGIARLVGLVPIE